MVSVTEIVWGDGRKQSLHALERPQLLMESGVSIALLCAADEDEQHRQTFNAQIPLNTLIEE